MKTTKQQRETCQLEVVETYNLYRSFERLRQPPFDGLRWKRALVHALGMSFCASSIDRQKIREALGLP